MDGKPHIISHFEAPGEDLGDRLEWIRNKIISLIKEYNIDEVVFEDIQLQDMAGGKDVGIKTFKILAEVFGVVHELMTELDMDYTIVPPIVWKATFKIAGKGRKVEKGKRIGYVGVSGNSFAPHLHYEVLRDTVVLDPVNHMFASVTPEEYLNMMILSVSTGQSMD